MPTKSLLFTAATLLYLTPAMAAFKSPPFTSNLEAQEPTGTKSVIIQMFEWTWDSVATECVDFIGPAGYGFVQVSPPAEHIQGGQWWTDYQPVSYTLNSKRGNRAQFANMVNTCHAAGVKVITDTIFNHMAGVESGKGVGESSFTHYNYPGIYQVQDFHHCGLEEGDNIVDYGNRLEVQTCQLVGLADLATDTDYVRGRLSDYANDLRSLGVDGFRLDAAKHIASADLANILSRVSGPFYVTQEVIFGSGDVVQPSEYVNNGDVQEFRYTEELRNTFLGGGIFSLRDLDNRGWVSGSGANIFVANHDTERNGGSLNANSPSNTYVTATIFSLAHPYGTPTILSSYSGFTDIDAGAPNGGVGTCSDTGGANGWLCQHRWIAFSGMVGFRNTVGSAPITNWVSPQSQQIAFGRGDTGFVAINNADTVWSVIFTTSMPDGSYCDVISGKATSEKCTGPSVTVSDGSFSVTVPARSAFAIHAGAEGSGTGGDDGCSSVAVTFEENAMTALGENIFLAGSISQLGTWVPAAAIALSPSTYPVWRTTVNLPANTTLQYKFIRKESDGNFIFESGPNRELKTGSSGSQTVSSEWK